MLPVLSNAFSSGECVREGKEWLWRIIGKCDDEGKLCGSFVRQAKELGIHGRIELLATQPVEEVARLTRSADIFLHPSLMESYGMSIAEAMASGCVVIAGRNRGTAELIRDGEDGLLCDTQDPGQWSNALHRLMSSPEEYRRMSEAAVRSADLLPSWEDTAQILLHAVEGSKAR
jgi:D-inositol-3-phosphate glycosyltransferase